MPLSLFAMMDSVMTRPLTVRCDKSRPDQFKAPLKLPDAQTTRNCRLEEIADGIVVNSQTKQRFTYSDPCVERGVTVAYQEEAHKASIQAVKEILSANLKLKLRLAPERALATLGALR
jgi:hypothetical protein